VDRVNGQLEKADLMKDSAVDAVESVGTAVRTLSIAITRPVPGLREASA
jgi:formylmethanofuran dehydrogenase subunit B